MTTEQIERIQTAMASGTAVCCTNADEAVMLFEAMEWRRKPLYHWLDNEYVHRWDCTYDRSSVPNGYQVINFSTLIAPQPHPLILGMREVAKAQGVDLEWLAEDVEFTIVHEGRQVGNICTIVNGYLMMKFGNTWYIAESAYWKSLFENTADIHPIPPKYSEETVEDAKAAMRLGFANATRDHSGKLWLCIAGDDIQINGAHFPEIQPGQCVRLEDIVGGE